MFKLILMLGCLPGMLNGVNLLQQPDAERAETDAAWVASTPALPDAYARKERAQDQPDAYYLALHTPDTAAVSDALESDWRQCIPGQFGDDIFVLRGFVRTEAATEAVLLLESRDQETGEWRTVFSSSETKPLQGTHAWTEVVLHGAVPPGADAVMARCVLRGAGAAWYSDVSLSRLDQASRDPDRALLESMFDQLERELAGLRKSNEALSETIEHIQSENEALRGALNALQSQLQELDTERQTDHASGTDAWAENQNGAATPPPHADNLDTIPPLLPHGISREGSH